MFYFVFFVASQMAKAPAIGIDLGTTYSCVSVLQNGTVKIIPNEQGNRITPSYVAFTKTERLIGEAAKNQIAMNSENTIFGKFIIIINYLFIFCSCFSFFKVVVVIIVIFRLNIFNCIYRC